jgi:hypothetical protein
MRGSVHPSQAAQEDLVQPAAEKTVDENYRQGVGYSGGCRAVQLRSHGP